MVDVRVIFAVVSFFYKRNIELDLSIVWLKKLPSYNKSWAISLLSSPSFIRKLFCSVLSTKLIMFFCLESSSVPNVFLTRLQKMLLELMKRGRT